MLRRCRGCGASVQTAHPNQRYCGQDCRQKTKQRNRLNRQTDDDLARKRQREAARLAENRDEINARRRELGKDPDRKTARRKTRRESYAKHRERRIQDSVEWQKRNPHLVSMRYAKRKAGERGYRVLPGDLIRQIHRQEGQCLYCSVRMTAPGRDRPTSLQWDHVVPLSRGGTHSIGNLIAACRNCNLSKGRSTVMEWKRRDET